jgi:hypothetical protein
MYQSIVPPPAFTFAPPAARSAPPPPPPAPAGAKRKAGQHLSEIAERDCKAVCQPDLTRPFSSLEDAVDRLLPYHILAGEDADAADAREAAEAGARLGATRRDAWEAQVTKRAGDLQRRVWAVNAAVEALERDGERRSDLPLLMLNSYAAAEAQQAVEVEKARQKREADEAKACAEAKLQAEYHAALAKQMELQMAAAAAAAAAAAPPQPLPPPQQQPGVPPVAGDAGAKAEPAAAPPPPPQAPAAAPPPVKKEEDKRSKLLALTKQMMSKR